MDGIRSNNWAWFAELFRDLLLQLGLVVQETNREVLQMVSDSDVLSKLNQRLFGAPPSKSARTSIHSLVDPSGETNTKQRGNNVPRGSGNSKDDQTTIRGGSMQE
jgi:hypothetical protein